MAQDDFRRPYDPHLDGWNIHKVRHQLSGTEVRVREERDADAAFEAALEYADSLED